MVHQFSWRTVACSLLFAAAFVIDAGVAHAQDNNMSVYGYFSTRLEKVFGEPEFDGTNVVDGFAPREFAYPSFNVMIQHQLTREFRAFVNLDGEDASTVNVANMWGEYRPSQYVAFRFGKTYRKFGLYNEILDAVPSYYGIEPPETFDGDHLLISRTSIFMVHGQAPVGTGTFRYAVSTDNGEGGIGDEGTIPLGFDANYTFADDRFTVGVSGYTSGGATGPDKGVGEGSPDTGVLPWMAADDFQVINGYAEARLDNLLLQFEYAKGMHEAVRDPDAVVAVLAGTGVNDAQLARFLIDPAGSQADPANVRAAADYDVEIWYFRAGYSWFTDRGEIGPYLQWDWYSNPETIASKRFGGDNEAGVADDGVFNKGTLGMMFRPIPRVAVKLDGSVHFYRFMGQKVNYPELRFDVSYTFGL